MIKILMILFMVLVSNSAMAKWIVVTIGDDDTSFYFDVDTIRKNKNMVKVWTLADYKTAKQGDLSAKILKEFDCKESTLRSVASSYYTGNMGSGNVTTSTNKVSDWSPVIPETIGEISWKYACGKNEISEAALSDSSLQKWVIIDSGDQLNVYAEIPQLSVSKMKKIPIKATVSKSSTVKIWGLWDYMAIQTAVDNTIKYSSFKFLTELECNDNNFRFLKNAYYSGNMGSGNVLWSYDNNPDGEWSHIVPDSVMEVLKKKACGQ